MVSVTLRVWLSLGLATLSQGVITPFGNLPEGCVKRAPTGSTIRDLGSLGVELEVPGGASVVHPPLEECASVEAQVRARQLAKASGKAGLSLDGWFEYTGYYPPSSSLPITFFNGTNTVPDTPKNQSADQVLYWFIGMQNNEDRKVRILQPVMTYEPQNGTAEGEPSNWSFTSWNCCPSGQAWYSDPITDFQEGDVLYGEVTASADLSEYTILSQTPGNSTALTVDTKGLTFDWADVTMEVYNVGDCSQFPTESVTFSDMTLLGSGGESLTPDWTVSQDDTCGGYITVVDPLKDIEIGQTTTSSRKA